MRHHIPVFLIPCLLAACSQKPKPTHVPDSPPRVLFAAPLELPQDIQANPPKDNAVFKVTISPDAKPTDIHLTHSSGNQQVDALCTSIIKRYKFRPAYTNNKPTTAPLTITFNFAAPQ